MRQAGVLASACIVALDEMIERLKEDHDNARKLAEGLANLEHIKIDPDLVDTNMVWIETVGSEFEAGQLCEQLKKKDILVLNLSKNLIRAVTHYGITGSDIDTTIAAVKEAINELRSPSKSLS